jgi:hypothetical protein
VYVQLVYSSVARQGTHVQSFGHLACIFFDVNTNFTPDFN